MTLHEKMIKLRDCAIEMELIDIDFIVARMNVALKANAEYAAIDISKKIREKALWPYDEEAETTINMNSVDVDNHLRRLALSNGAKDNIKHVNCIIQKIDLSNLYVVQIKEGGVEYLVYKNDLLAALEKYGVDGSNRKEYGTCIDFYFKTNFEDHTLTKRLNSRE